MSHAFVIHIAGRVAGIVARDHGGQAFRFFASSSIFDPLEGALFDQPERAERAARRLFKARNAGPLRFDDQPGSGPQPRSALRAAV